MPRARSAPIMWNTGSQQSRVPFRISLTKVSAGHGIVNAEQPTPSNDRRTCRRAPNTRLNSRPNNKLERARRIHGHFVFRLSISAATRFMCERGK